MSRTTNILLLMVMLATTQANMDFSIGTTWNGGPLDHAPVKLALKGQLDGSLQIMIEAPFFNDPANPGGKPGEPFFGLWEYEVVEAFFLNDNEEYLEVEVCPWGQHIVLMLAGQRNTIRHSLPIQVSTDIDNTTNTWTGMATIPADFLPQATTKFNAYAIHGSGKDRIYESLYPAPSTAENPDFHALQYFQAIDLSSELPTQSTDPMSKFWEDAINGVFPYSITTDWKGEQMEQEPIKITIQGFEAGVELNVSAPFFNDPKPDGPQGAFFGLWDYEVVEMFFLNDNDEYLEVEVGPWGHHILLMLKGERNTIKHSLPLDYFSERQENTWSGSAMIPPAFFPPNVTRMNAYAIHGVGENRVYQALYPAPINSENPDFHRLGLFQPMDFEYQVTDNSEYSDIWQDAIDNAMLRVNEETKEKDEEVNDVVTSFGPFFEYQSTTEIPAEEEEEVTMLSVIRNPDEKETDMSSQKAGINQADTKDTVSVRPLSRRPSITRPSSSRRPIITQAPSSRRPSPSRRRPTVSTSQRKPVSSPEENEVNTTEQPEEEEANVNVRPLPRRPSPKPSQSRRRPTESPIQRKPILSQEENEVNVTEQPEEKEEANFNVRPLPRRPSPKPAPSRRRPTASPIQRKPTSSTEENEVNVTEQPEEEEVNFNVRPLPRRPTPKPAPSIRRPTVSANLRKPVSSPEENEVNVTEQPEENEVDVSVRPIRRRPSPSRRRPARPTVSPTRSPARRRPQPQPVKIDTQQIDNSVRPIQNRRLDDDRGNSGNFLPDQKFPTNVLRPTQFLRPIQRPVPQIVERPPQEEITFNQEDEKLQIPSEEEIHQKNNEQKDKSENIDGTDKETATDAPGTEENLDIIQQEENLQSAPLVPLELLHHPVCREAGLIPDQLRCMVFHECVIEDGQWQLYSWRCKRGHHYDPHTVSCVRGRCNLSLG